MKKIYINESQLDVINDFINNEEVTIHEFCVGIKSLLKDLLKKPHEAKPSEIFTKKGIKKDDLLSKMRDIGLIVSSENITEVPNGKDGKLVAKHTIQYKVPKENFNEKLESLYKELFTESHDNKPQVFSNTPKIIGDMLEMDYDNAYKNRGGYDKNLVSEEGEGGGATSCGSVMQGGGSNPSAGQYDVPFKNVQRRSFWNPALTRNKDSKNKSISMNRK